MSAQFSCSCGHRWQGDAAASASCPQCGSTGSYLQGAAGTPAPGPTAVLATAALSEPGAEASAAHAGPAGPSIPGYEVLGELGRGGMGVVYKGRQIALNRVVALKVILGHAADAQERRRFHAEALAVARLSHPGIVQIYEVGEHQGCPYLALEYLEGGSLAEQVRDRPLPPEQAARLTAALAHAIHAAHEQGIVHRDLKPANILLQGDAVALHVGDSQGRGSGAFRGSGRYSMDAPVGTPLARAVVPKVADFGLARRLDGDSLQTHSGAIVGTPSYMAPEQAEGRGAPIGPATDVYGLGAILYECLTGRPPLVGRSVLDTLEQVRSREPEPPRRLQPGVPHDLDLICRKCLEKEPGRRYASAHELALDLERFLAGEPIRARRASVGQRLAKWARREPVLAALSVLLAFAFTGGTAFVARAWYQAEDKQRELSAIEADLLEQAHRLERASQEADRAREQATEEESNLRAAVARAERSRQATELMLTQDAWVHGRPFQALQLLEGSPAELAGWEWHEFRRRMQAEQVRFPGVHEAVFDPGGRFLLTLSRSGHILLRPGPWQDGADTAEARVVAEEPSGVGGVALGPGGRVVAAACHDGRVRLRELPGGRLLQTLEGHGQPARAVALDAASSLLASSGEDGTVKLWSLPSGQLLFSRPGPGNACHDLAFSPDGKYLACPGPKTGALIYETATGNRVAELAPSARVLTVAFAPDGKSVAIGGYQQVQLWDAGTWTWRVTFRPGQEWVRRVRFRPDGQRLAVACDDGTIRSWNLPRGEAPALLRGHLCAPTSLAWSPDGRWLATAASDATVRLWRDGRPREPRILDGPPGQIASLSFHPRGRLLAVASASSGVLLWDVAQGKLLRSWTAHPHWVLSVAYSPNGRLLATGGSHGLDLVAGAPGQGEGRAPQGEVAIWDATTGAELFRECSHPEDVHCVAFGPDARLLASVCQHEVQVRDVETGELLWRQDGCMKALAFSPDGRYLAVLAFENDSERLHISRGVVRLFETVSGKAVRSLLGASDSLSAVAFSPDGRQVAAGGGAWFTQGEICIWDTASGALLHTLTGHGSRVLTLAYHPDGRRLVSGGWNAGLIVWDPIEGRELLSLEGHTRGILAAAFSPDGRLLASGSGDETVRLWDGRPLSLTQGVRGPTARVVGAAIAHDLVALGGEDGSVLLRDAQTLRERARWPGTGAAHRTLLFSPASSMLAGGDDQGTLRLWAVATGTLLHTQQAHPGGKVLGLAWSPDGRFVATCGEDKRVCLWDPRTGERLREYTGHTQYVMCVAVSPDGKTLASVGGDGTIRLWDPATGQDRRTIPWPIAVLNTVAFSPDGTLLAAAGAGGEVRLFDPRTGNHLASAAGHHGHISTLAFSPDGRTLAAGGAEAVVALWDVSGVAQRLERTEPPRLLPARLLYGHVESISLVRFSSDGRRLLSRSTDGVVRLRALEH